MAAAKGAISEEWQERAEGVQRMARWDDLHSILTLEMAPRRSFLRPCACSEASDLKSGSPARSLQQASLLRCLFKR